MIRLGAIAQLGERLAGSQKVVGSSPTSSMFCPKVEPPTSWFNCLPLPSTILTKVEPAQPFRGLGLRRLPGEQIESVA
jgi:hypothetical protein